MRRNAQPTASSEGDASRARRRRAPRPTALVFRRDGAARPMLGRLAGAALGLLFSGAFGAAAVRVDAAGFRRVTVLAEGLAWLETTRRDTATVATTLTPGTRSDRDPSHPSDPKFGPSHLPVFAVVTARQIVPPTRRFDRSPKSVRRPLATPVHWLLQTLGSHRRSRGNRPPAHLRHTRTTRCRARSEHPHEPVLCAW